MKIGGVYTYDDDTRKPKIIVFTEKLFGNDYGLFSRAWSTQIHV